MPLCQYQPRQIKVFGVMGVGVLRIRRLDEIIALCRQNDIVGGKRRYNLSTGCDAVCSAKMTAVVDQPDGVGVQVPPCPVETGQLTPVCIASADVLTVVIPPESDVRMPRRPRMKREIDGILRHTVRLVRCDDDPDALRRIILFLHSRRPQQAPRRDSTAPTVCFIIQRSSHGDQFRT